MFFIQREIERHRCRDCVLQVTDEHGQPLADAAVSVYQVASDFMVGARWSPEEDVMDFARYAERVARWGTHLLTSVPPPPELLAPCQAQGLQFTTEHGGISLALPSQRRWHMATLRRYLLEVAEQHGAFFVYDVRAPLAGKEFSPKSFAVGGSERVQSDYLVELATVCFSVPQVRGFFYGNLTDLPNEHPPSGLLTSQLRPRRAFKVVSKLFHNEWRTRTSGVTDAAGRFAWRGFCGTYQWTARARDDRWYRGIIVA
jgi:hypothetical protein